MFRFTFSLFLCLSLLFPHQWHLFPQLAYAQQTAIPARQVEHLAILDFDAKGGITKDEASIITERFRAQILRRT